MNFRIDTNLVLRKIAALLYTSCLAIVFTSCGAKPQQSPEPAILPSPVDSSIEILSILNKASIEIEKTEIIIVSDFGETANVPISITGVDMDDLSKKGVEIRYNWFNLNKKDFDGRPLIVSTKRTLTTSDAGYFNLEVEFIKDKKVIKKLSLGPKIVHIRWADDALFYMFPQLKAYINNDSNEINTFDGEANVNIDAHIDLGATKYDKSKVLIIWQSWTIDAINGKKYTEYTDHLQDNQFVNRLHLSNIYLPIAGIYSITAKIYYEGREVGNPILLVGKVNVQDIHWESLAHDAKNNLSPVLYYLPGYYSEFDSDFYKNATRVVGPISIADSRYFTIGFSYGPGPSGNFMSWDRLSKLKFNTRMEYKWTNSDGKIISTGRVISPEVKPGNYKFEIKFINLLDNTLSVSISTEVEFKN